MIDYQKFFIALTEYANKQKTLRQIYDEQNHEKTFDEWLGSLEALTGENAGRVLNKLTYGHLALDLQPTSTDKSLSLKHNDTVIALFDTHEDNVTFVRFNASLTPFKDVPPKWYFDFQDVYGSGKLRKNPRLVLDTTLIAAALLPANTFAFEY